MTEARTESRPVFVRNVPIGETRESWCRSFYAAVRTQNVLYRTNGAGFLYIDPAQGPRRILTHSDFYGLAHSLVEVVEERERARTHEQFLVPAYLANIESQILYSSPESMILPSVEILLTEPVVIPQADGTYRATVPGYDPEALTYYWTGSSVPIEPIPHVHHLLQCFSGVPFAKPEYRNNLFAWLLGAICLDPLVDLPLLVVSGNQQGVGKSSCVQAAGHILAGRIPAPLNFRGSEFWKDISARFIDGDRVLFLDNIVCRRAAGFDHPHLSTLLTQGRSKKIRVLGHSRMCSANGLLFAASLNDAKLSTDLADRSLPVYLYREQNEPMVPYCREYAIKHRSEIYGELLGLALTQAAAVNVPTAPTFRFRGWLDFIGPRILSAFGPMALQESADLDDLSQELIAYGFDNINTEFDSDALIHTVQAQPDRYPSLHQKINNISSDRARKISVTRLLRGLTARIFSPLAGQSTSLRLLDLESDGKHAVATFVFREVQA